MDGSRRILILPSWYPPDGGYFFKEHSEALAASGWRVDVLVNRVVGIRKLLQAGSRALVPFRIKEEEGLRVVWATYLKVPGSERYNIGGWARKTCRLYGRYQREYGKPDLILAHSATWAGYAASLIRKRYGIPYLVVEHRSFFVWSTPEARAMVKPFYLPFLEKAYRHCAKVVLVSQSMQTGLQELMPWIKEKSMVIPNMIREDMFQPPVHPRKADPFVFLWAGRLEHVKGIDLLLEAVGILKQRAALPFRVRLAGRGSLRIALEEQAERLGIQDRVTFLGRISREEILQEMQQANCFVLPSRYEAFGAVLIEAMATGLPMIATRSGGPDYIVTHKAGILIDPEDPAELADAMEQMMLTSHTYSQQAIRVLTLERYGQSQVVARYQNLFKQLLEDQKIL